LYLVDLGISRKYWDSDKNAHIPYFEYRELHGTARYSSINAHCGVELSRRDDLESMVYVLIYLHNGSLPWQNVKVRHKQDYYEQILQQKMNLCESNFLEVNGFDKFFSVLLEYVLNLRFTDLPDYEWMKNLFVDCANRHGFSSQPWTWKYEWNKFDLHPAWIAKGSDMVRVPLKRDGLVCPRNPTAFESAPYFSHTHVEDEDE
jgi:hypothetical protein